MPTDDLGPTLDTTSAMGSPSDTKEGGRGAESAASRLGGEPVNESASSAARGSDTPTGVTPKGSAATEFQTDNPFRPGDRVIRKYDGRYGIVHAIYDDHEDNTEVKLNNGVYTCVHWSKFQAVTRG